MTMIFTETLEKVLSGEKTQTRRKVKAGHVLAGYSPNERVTTWNRTVYAVGGVYSVQPGRGKPAVAKIEITAIRRERVSLISEDDIRAEGFASREEFISTWEKINGPNSGYNDEAWVITFKLVEGGSVG